MKPELFVNISTAHMTAEDLDFLRVQHLHPELYFSAADMDALTPAQLGKLHQEMQAREFRPICHAPFYDLNLGAHDPKVRALAQERVFWALDTARQFGAPQVVIHPGYGPWVLVRAFPNWLKRAHPHLAAIVARAKELGVRVAFENIYDPDPHDLVEILKAFPEPHVGICFDTGHFNLFSQVSMKTWLEAFGDRLFECHLHDNLGSEDDHIAVGDGCLKFGPLVQWLKAQPALPRLTLEMEQKTHVIKSVRRVREWFAPLEE
ncbi:MAG: hypothetical protein OZSIB_2569 [Candidatus Ozemobacter sibiricus]|uniref:Xylose isomerase-like TIM barrel domain-containing protein n=1 Tax=Candidatus Ozemobacter sibiricus TaxID=2268124 RepID=A0A367Z8I5_9BACT|nr:MAG: hypothetical protein OZSIB_2569 [Candidatus Ozemobacter sibiricus]